MNNENLTLHTDKYQINMMYAHWKNGTHNKKRAFEAYFRKLPFGNGFAVFAGLERIVRYIESLQFTELFLSYLAEQEEEYDRGFLEELRQFSFTGSIRSVPEGTIVFPNEPLIQVEARIFEAQLVETALLNFMNFQTLIATKAARIRKVAPHEILLEFGTRRAQEADAAIWGARAAYLAGFDATSNMIAGMQFGIPTKGTHAHSWVQDHKDEEEAFQLFADALPDQVSLLVDTYDTLKSGVPNAIKVAKRLKQKGKNLQSIRIDSGDLTYLSIMAREMLDQEGLQEVKICASNDLDEHTIENLKNQDAKIDIWGVGTQLITAADHPSLGGVYKLVAKQENEEWEPTIKISGNPEKITTPGLKKVYRIINRQTGKSEGDYIALSHEEIHTQEKLNMFDPIHTWIQKWVVNFTAIELLKPVFMEGKLVYNLPSLSEIRSYHKEQLSLFWEEYLRKLNPERYPVDLSQALWDLKNRLITEKNKR